MASSSNNSRNGSGSSGGSILTYLEGRGWSPTYHRYGSDIYTGFCPFHSEQHPSFYVYEGKHYARCYGQCDAHFSLPYMIASLEGLSYPQARERARAYGYSAMGQTGQQRTLAEPRAPGGAPPASEEQQETLAAVMAWWHECLWMPRCRSALAYLRDSRGVGLSTLDELQLGYAPDARDGWVWAEMPRFLTPLLGGTWLSRLQDVGVMRRGRMRVQNRLMFTCLSSSSSPGQTGRPVFYTGRALPGMGTRGTEQSPRYLNPSGMEKVPFSLPLRAEPPALAGTVYVESPMGCAVAHQYGFPARATLGPDSLVWRNYAGDGSPRLVATDNDAAGEKQAANLLTFFRTHKQPTWRILPTKKEKGFDEWLHYAGTAPFLAQVAQHQQEQQEQEESALVGA